MTKLKELLVAAEKRFIAMVLLENKLNRTHSARALGMSRRTLLNKIKAHKLKTYLAVREAANAQAQS